MAWKYSSHNCILYILSTTVEDSESYLNLLFYQAIARFSLSCGSWCTSVGWGSNDSLIFRAFAMVFWSHRSWGTDGVSLVKVPRVSGWGSRVLGLWEQIDVPGQVLAAEESLLLATPAVPASLGREGSLHPRWWVPFAGATQLPPCWVS